MSLHLHFLLIFYTAGLMHNILQVLEWILHSLFIMKRKESWHWIRYSIINEYLQQLWITCIILLNPSFAPLQPFLSFLRFCPYFAHLLCLKSWYQATALNALNSSSFSAYFISRMFFLYYSQASLTVHWLDHLILIFKEQSLCLPLRYFHPIYSNIIFFQLELRFLPAVYQQALRTIALGALGD